MKARRSGAQGLTPITHETYRGFVFARLADGPAFREYFGDSLSSIDNLADRSPEGELEIAGGCLRYLHNCNWKMFVENLNDTMHPMIVHASSAGTAKKLWEGKPPDLPKPMAIEQYAPFANDYKFFDDMGVRVYPHGHGFSGVNFSIHSSYSSIPEYEEAMKRAYGDERAKQILGTVRHNTVYYPSLTIKGAIQSIRVARPLAADRTVIESWTFRLKGAPAKLLERTVMYNRLINSPMSVVGHDDLHCYRSAQEGLAAEGNEWVSLHRNFDPAEVSPAKEPVTGQARSRCATSSAPGASSWRHDRGRCHQVHLQGSAAAGRKTLRRVVRALHRRCLLLGAASAGPDRSPRP